MRTPYLAVIGQKEADERTVTPRSQKTGDMAPMGLEEFADLVASRRSKCPS